MTDDQIKQRIDDLVDIISTVHAEAKAREAALFQASGVHEAEVTIRQARRDERNSAEVHTRYNSLRKKFKVEAERHLSEAAEHLLDDIRSEIQRLTSVGV